MTKRQREGDRERHRETVTKRQREGETEEMVVMTKQLKCFNYMVYVAETKKGSLAEGKLRKIVRDRER